MSEGGAGTSRIVAIPGRYCGPPASGNGGYASGLVGSALDGAAEVSLRRPPPLDVPLRLEADDEGATLLEGDEVVARATPVDLDLALPPAPTAGEVAAATTAFDHAAYAAPHPFPGCFTCGPGRPEGDGLRLFPAALGRDDLVAWPWAPDRSLVSADGLVEEPVVWAALDCPSGLAWIAEAGTPAVLGRMAAAVHRRPAPGESLVVGGWRIADEGRKLRAGSAVWSAEGEVLARCAATWVVLTPEQQAAFGVTGV